MPRVIGPATSDRCLIGVTSMQHRHHEGDEAAHRAAAWLLCHSATTITAESASAAIICVSGVMVEAATVA